MRYTPGGPGVFWTGLVGYQKLMQIGEASLTPSLLLPNVLWAFFGLSVVATGGLVYGSYNIISDEDYSWQSTMLSGLAQLATMGFMVCTLVLLGHPIAALEVWRIFSVLIAILTLLFAFGSLRKFIGVPGRKSGTSLEGLASVGTVSVAIIPALFAGASFQVRALPYIDGRLLGGTGNATTSAGASSAALISGSNALGNLAQLDFWHTALYVLLIATTVIFGLLFITATIREGPLSIEKNWGGLGGNSGGWEISSSLTYLVATIATGVLLLSLIYHSDKLRAEAKAGPVTAQPDTLKTAPSSDKPASSAPTGAAPEGNKSAPAGTGALSTTGTQPGVHPDAH